MNVEMVPRQMASSRACLDLRHLPNRIRILPHCIQLLRQEGFGISWSALRDQSARHPILTLFRPRRLPHRISGRRSYGIRVRMISPNTREDAPVHPMENVLVKVDRVLLVAAHIEALLRSLEDAA